MSPKPSAGQIRDINNATRYAMWSVFKVTSALPRDRDALAAEVDRGAATKARDAILMTFAEGLGGAVLLDGKIYRGRGAAGEVGYMVTDAFGAEGAYHGVGALEGKLFELVAEDARRDGIDPALCACT